ncbi:MAG: BamA/TamA family outer membrane protein [Verrucomicrobiota bacterium]
MLRQPGRGGGRADWKALLCCLLFPAILGAAGPEQATPATLRITGYGPIGNRKLKKNLQLLGESGKKPEYFDANFVEDAALVLVSRLHRDGFEKPSVQAELTLDDGRVLHFEWDKAVRDEPLPRPLRVRELHFHIEEGVLYYFGDIQVQAGSILAERQVRSYFVEIGPLIAFKRTRVYSPDRLARGLASLTEILNRRGHENAQVQAVEVALDDRTGRVNLVLAVRPGPRSIVRSIRHETFSRTNSEPDRVTLIATNRPFSKLWLQDYSQQIRATNFHRGYPDATVEITQLRRDQADDQIAIDLLAQEHSGPLIRLGDVKFEGQKRSKLSFLNRRVRLHEDRPLDRIQVEEARYRLAKLGIFESVALRYEPVDEETRDVIYTLKEGKTIDLSLLGGYGSYELLRGGLELEQNNLFGRAHHARLRLVQSIKASYGEYIYTMPELVGEDLDVFFNGSALRREEIDFTREEFGGGLGVRKYVDAIQSDVRLRYSYDVLHAAADEESPEEGLSSADVGAFIAEIRHDHQDNPLYPRQGYKLFGTFEVASEYLAGDVNYQRFELNAAYHQPLDPGRWLHFGLSHGAVLTLGSSAEDLPFNRRFFPGGDNSIRGYQQGEAAPRNARGKIVGAETYLFGSVEFEQSLTPAWSLVTFVDTASFARRMRDYPFNESLFSVGGGIRWKTIIGPVRLEYGHNLNPREHDPSGTIQFSVGFPF